MENGEQFFSEHPVKKIFSLRVESPEKVTKRGDKAREAVKVENLTLPNLIPNGFRLRSQN